METLKQEVIRLHKCTEHVVIDEPSYVISLLKFDGRRSFTVCSAESKGNLSNAAIEEIFSCLTEFIKNNPEDSPCYCLIDTTNTELFTLHHLQTASATLRSVRTYLETRLIGSVVKISADHYHDGFLTKTFKRLYTPVRPVKWYNEEGDGANFITEWETKIC